MTMHVTCGETAAHRGHVFDLVNRSGFYRQWCVGVEADDTFDPDRDRMECCGNWAHEGHAPGCDNAPPVTGCRLCDGLGSPCEEHAFQLSEERREWNADRFMEALLGARLRFHVGLDADGPDWRPVYARWADLYRDGQSREGAYRV